MDYFSAFFHPERLTSKGNAPTLAHGSQCWDCTKFVNDEALCEGFKTMEYHYAISDSNGVLKRDPNAPQWIKNWDGPFGIDVTRYADETEMLVSLARQDSEDAMRRLRERYDKISHERYCSMRFFGECDCIKSEIALLIEKPITPLSDFDKEISQLGQDISAEQLKVLQFIVQYKNTQLFNMLKALMDKDYSALAGMYDWVMEEIERNCHTKE